MNKKAISYSITMYGADRCSGFCVYCSAAASSHYTMGFKVSDNLEEVKQSIIDTDKETYETIQFDFDALEKRLDDDIKNVKKIDNTEGVVLNIDVWGADPLSCFQSLQELYDFLDDFCKNRKMTLKFHTSTNGLPFLRDDILPWLREHDVHIQLSHDGLGQWMRTKDLDPVDIPNLREAIRTGTLDWINTTLSFWNYSLLENRRYWINKLRDIFPEVFDDVNVCSVEIDRIYRKLFIKLNHIYNGDYDIKSKNLKGLFNGKVYESLKGSTIGDLQLRNRVDLAEEYNIPELAHVLDNYISEWDLVYNALLKADANNPYWLPFRNYLTSQAQRFKELPHDDSRHKIAGACHAFQTYKNFDKNLGKPTTFVIDTLGNYCECNLLDSRNHVMNPTAQQPAYCKGCKYEFQHECNGCGSMQYPKRCEYMYRWVSWLESIHNRSNINNKKGADRRQGACNCKSTATQQTLRQKKNN